MAFEVKALRARTVVRNEPADEPASAEPALVGQSALMRGVFRDFGLAAATGAAVLILGKSGTGRELCAAALDRHSDRATGPFIRVNCGALPEGLSESELLGHERSAFTGPDRQKARPVRARGWVIPHEVSDGMIARFVAIVLIALIAQEFEKLLRNFWPRREKHPILIVFASGVRAAGSRKNLEDEDSSGHLGLKIYHRLSLLSRLEEHQDATKTQFAFTFAQRHLITKGARALKRSSIDGLPVGQARRGAARRPFQPGEWERAIHSLSASAEETVRAGRDHWSDGLDGSGQSDG
jgi:hypothetical protein